MAKLSGMPVRPSSPHPAARGVETDLGLTRRARRINRALAAEYPDAHCELDFTSPFELTVATVLSAQTTDVRVNQVTPELFRRFPTPAALAAAEPGELEGILRPLGFFRAKARSLIGLGEALLAHFDGRIPRDFEDLVTLPGVGRKTALVVRGNAFGLPGLAVDTHVSRLAQRLMLTEETDVLRIEQALCARIEKKEWTMFSHRMIFHGRRVCHARRPECGACVIARDCPSREVAA